MTVEIPLTQGQVALVDDIDGDLAQFRWTASFDSKRAGGGRFVASRAGQSINGKQASIYMHRIIVGRMISRQLLSSEHVDHINGDPLDNRRANLRLATRSQNLMNTRKHVQNTSGFKGVSWNKRRGKWVAQIQVNGKKKYLGYFDDPIQAHEAYKIAAAELHGEFARFE